MGKRRHKAEKDKRRLEWHRSPELDANLVVPAAKEFLHELDSRFDQAAGTKKSERGNPANLELPLSFSSVR